MNANNIDQPYLVSLIANKHGTNKYDKIRSLFPINHVYILVSCMVTMKLKVKLVQHYKFPL